MNYIYEIARLCYFIVGFLLVNIFIWSYNLYMLKQWIRNDAKVKQQ